MTFNKVFQVITVIVDMKRMEEVISVHTHTPVLIPINMHTNSCSLALLKQVRSIRLRGERSI